MKKFKSYIQGTDTRNDQLLSLLIGEFSNYKYNIISICAAYVTYKGLFLVRELLSQLPKNRSRWLIGTDDFISEPNAIRLALWTRNSEVRTVSMLPKARFHAKAFLLENSDQNLATLIIGSNNLTESALKKNCETFTFRRAKSKAEVKRLRNYWEHLWKLGIRADESSIAKYENQRKRRKVCKLPDVEDEKTSTQSSAKKKMTSITMLSTTSKVWIELGKNTGAGGQLEIVKPLAPFLGLPNSPSKGTSVQLNMKTQKGYKIYNLTYTKGMWRFMNLQKGFYMNLRPDLSRPSPFILVIEFSNGNKVPKMKVLRKTLKKAKKLIASSKLTGFIGKSIPTAQGREFGWL